MELNVKDFWNRVKNLSTERGHTVNSLSKELGFSLSDICKRGEFPNLQQAYFIANYLHTSIEFLLTGKDSSETARQLRELKQDLSNIISKYYD